MGEVHVGINAPSSLGYVHTNFISYVLFHCQGNICLCILILCF